jgi:hypothetical protein
VNIINNKSLRGRNPCTKWYYPLWQNSSTANSVKVNVNMMNGVYQNGNDNSNEGQQSFQNIPEWMNGAIQLKVQENIFHQPSIKPSIMSSQPEKTPPM